MTISMIVLDGSRSSFLDMLSPSFLLPLIRTKGDMTDFICKYTTIDEQYN